MKAISMSLLCLIGYFFISPEIHAQLIQNRGFEMWTVDSTQCPTGFECTNQETFDYVSVQSVIKQTNAYSGMYALELKTNITAKDTFVGYYVNGDVDNDAGGVAYVERPDSMAGFCKYNVMAGDTAFVLAIFRKAGQRIGTCLGTFVGQENNYTRFSFPVNWSTGSSIMPDSLTIGAASSNVINELGVSQGSTLTLDSLFFVGNGNPTKMPNADFEDWEKLEKHTPKDWHSFLDYPHVYKLNLVNRLTKPADVHQGMNAIEIVSKIEGKDTLTGFLSNFDQRTNKGGYAYTKRVDTLMGYYKFSSPKVDSGSVYVILSKDTLVHYQGRRLPPSNVYRKFELPINCPFHPDSIKILFLASRGHEQDVVPGSTLSLDELDFKVCDKPRKPLAAVFPTKFCQNAGNQSYSVTPQMDATHGYVWNFPTGMTITSTPSDSNHVRVSVAAGMSGPYNVAVSAKVYCGTGDEYIEAIMIDSIPVKPSVSILGDTLRASGNGAKYNWFKGSQQLFNDTLSYLVIDTTKNEKYKVVIVNGQCYSDTGEYEFMLSFIREYAWAEKVSVYPNPSNGLFQIRVNDGSVIRRLTVYNVAGVLLQSQTEHLNSLDISHLPTGMYILSIENDESSYRMTVLKK